MVPALDILSYGHCNCVCYLWFRRQTSLVKAFVKMCVIYGSGVRHPQLRRLLTCLLSMVRRQISSDKAFVKMFVIYDSGVRHPQLRRLLKGLLSMDPALDILSYRVCYNVCYLWFRCQISSVSAFVKLFVIYDSGVRHPQLRHLLYCLLSIISALDILSYGQGNNVCYLQFGVRHPQLRQLE